MWPCTSLACVLGVLFLAQQSLHAATVGTVCKNDAECGDVNSTSCYEGDCSCRAGYVQSVNKTDCVAQVIGRSCIATAEICVIDNSYCDNGVCACVRDTHVPSFNKTMCLEVVATLRGSCDEDQQCINDALGLDTMCVNRECVCRYGVTNISRPCDQRKKLDDWCSSSQQCQNIAHASCIQKKCACDPFFVPKSSSRTECIPIATRFGSDCTEHIQCTAAFGGGGFCSNEGKCRCLSAFHFVINRTTACVVTRGLNERCSSDDECFLPEDGAKQNTACVGRTCVCRAGIEPRVDNLSCAGAKGLDLSLYSACHLLLFALLATTTTTLLGSGI